jgi:DNA-directed RNA polymerase I and III subunit RPAC2
MSVNDQRTAPATEEFTVLEGEDEYAATFVFGNEDHTLGNCLRHTLMQKRETEFCGYSVPHPYEPKMNVRLQVSKDKPALTVLKQGLNELGETACIIDEHFVEALRVFDAANSGDTVQSGGAGAKPKKSKKR